MPMYEFACRSCEHPFEKRLQMSQSSIPQTCPNCGSGNTRRRISTSIAIGGLQAVGTTLSAPLNSPFT